MNMNKYLDLFATKERIEVIENFNSLVRANRKLPFFKNFSNDKYEFFRFKKFILKFLPFFSLIKQVIKSFFSYVYAYTLASIFLSGLNKVEFFNNLFFSSSKDLHDIRTSYIFFITFLVYISIGLLSNPVDKGLDTLDKYQRYFNYEPKAIVINELVFGEMLKFLARTFVFLWGILLFSTIGPRFCLTLSLVISLVKFSASIFWMEKRIKEKRSLLENGFVQLLIAIIFFLGSTSLLFLYGKKFILIISTLSLIIFLPSIHDLKKFSSYEILVENARLSYKKMLGDVDKVITRDLDVDDKNLSKTKFRGSSGFAFLNSLFFQRHRKILLKAKIISTLFFLVSGMIILVKFKNMDNIPNFEAILTVSSAINFLVLNEENIQRQLFINCDQGLISYGFYRQRKNVLKMFELRCFSLFKILSIPVAGLCLISLIYGKLANISEDKLIILFSLIGLAWIFYTIYPLFRYYIFQPFNQDGISGGFVNGFVKFLCYLIVMALLPYLGSKITHLHFLYLNIALVITFIGLSITMVYFLSEKTFKVRR